MEPLAPGRGRAPSARCRLLRAASAGRLAWSLAWVPVHLALAGLPFAAWSHLVRAPRPEGPGGLPAIADAGQPAPGASAAAPVPVAPYREAPCEGPWHVCRPCYTALRIDGYARPGRCPLHAELELEDSQAPGFQAPARRPLIVLGPLAGRERPRQRVLNLLASALPA